MSSHSSEHLKKYFDPSRGEKNDVMIRAGAGAGKTTELVRRVISLALVQHQKNGEWPRLVVTTFTRKATQELRERLLQAGMAIGNEKLLQYLQSSQSLHISTIHGILTVYLKRFGRELDLPPDFQIMDQIQMTRMARRILRNTLKDSHSFAEDFQILSEEIELSALEKAAEQWWSFKTEEKNARRLTRKDLENDFSEFVEELLGDTVNLVSELERVKLTDAWSKWLPVFKSFVADSASLQIPLKMFDADLSERSDVEAQLKPSDPFSTIRNRASAFIESAVGLRIAKTKDVNEELKDLAYSIRERIEALTEFPCQAEYWDRHEDMSLRFERLAEAWGTRIRDEKIRLARLTMEDLELFALWLVEKNPETAHHFSEEWDYWLIDEYQDTSPRQVKLIQSLTQGRKVFLVGDPQQSIYLFRGARSEVFIQAEEMIRSRGGETLQLMTNYRTSAPVLEYMNDLFTSVSSQLSPMLSGRAEEEIPFHHIHLWQLPKERKAEGLQAEAVLQRIQEIIQAGVSPESICVLSRKRADLSAIAQRGAELGVPCQLHAAGQFFERREITDALCFLQFLVTPEDNVNLVGLLRSPWMPLTDQQILKICHPEVRSFWSVLRTKSDDSEYQSTVEVLTEALARIQREGIARVWRDLLVQQGIFDFALKLDASGRREANLWKLVQNLFSQEGKPGFRITEFLEQPEITDTESSGSSDASPVIEPKRVQLMTVHASKGLQFPHVIVPYMDDDLIKVDRSFLCWNEMTKTWGVGLRDPDSQKISAHRLSEVVYEMHKQRGREELDRLFYVALTRSQSSLSLIWGALGEKSKGKEWVSGLLRSSVREETACRIHFREERPETQTFVIEESKPLKVREPWQNKQEPLGIRQVLTVTNVLGPSTTTAPKATTNSRQGWEKVRSSVRGTDVHRLMESLKYDPSRRLVRPEFQKALDFIDQGEGQFLKFVIESGEVEWGFAVQIEHRLLQGQIDLWGRDEFGRAWVVDYKTGNPDASESALAQLEIYTWALRKLGKVTADEPVKMAAVFPFHNHVVQKDAPLQAEIEKVLSERIALI